MAKRGSANHYKNNIRARFNLTVAEYEGIKRLQKGRCAICNFKPKKHEKQLVLDHNHNTLEIRGFLCDWCNVALGRFKDNINIMFKAIIYLLKHPYYGKIKKTRKA